jgi:transposase
MPQRYPAEVEDRAVRMVLDGQGDYPSLRAACVAISERLGVTSASQQRWVDQAQVGAGAKAGVSSSEIEEIKALKAEVKPLREVNEILRSASIFFAREPDPRPCRSSPSSTR